MRPTPLGSSLLLGLMLASPAWTAPQEPASRPAERPEATDMDERFAALEAELEKAMSAFYEALDELPEDTAYEDYPPYPGETFYPRFRELADAGHLDSLHWCFGNRPYDSRTSFADELETLLLAAPGDERNGDIMAYMHWSAPGSSPELLAVIDAYAETAPTDQLVHAALGAKGMVLTMDETDKEATAKGLALLEELLLVKMDFPGRSGIEGHIFKLKNLGIGMVAPDWSATDVDGEPIALADYRGKVTVLEFWGFW